MSLTILDELEAKIKQAVETIQLLQLEIEELKEKNETAKKEHEQLKAEQQNFQDRLRSLLGQIENV